MPSYVSPTFITNLLKLYIGTGTACTGLYMALGGPEVGATDGNGNASGYSRKAIPVSSLTVGGGTLTLPTETWTFTATPSQPSANAWYVYDAASGGNVLFSGPLGQGPGGKLTAAATAGGGGITVATSAAASIAVGDVLKLGSSCDNNEEFPTVSSIGADNGGNTIISCGVAKAHPVGEAWSHDSRTRTFFQGYVEIVSAAVSITSQP